MVDYDKLLQDLQDEWQVSGLGPDDMYGQYAIEIAKRANSAILAERDALKTELGATSRMLAEFLVAMTHPWNLITNENWNIPKLEQRVILFSNGVVQDESYTLDRGDDGYFWWREDLDECPEVKEGDAWIPWPSGPTL
jgi:hypothetical protein